MKKGLGIGEDSFSDLREKNCYYVDKTAFLKPLLTSPSTVYLITRPRRFGKSLFLETLREFLEINPEAPGDVSRQTRLFASLRILEEKDFCTRFMGQHPVLYLNFQSVDGENFEEARQALASVLWKIADAYVYLLESPRLSTEDKSFLREVSSRKYLRDPAHLSDLKLFLERMAVMLAKHFARQVVLLIDEYDVPLRQATAKGFYAPMVTLIRALLSFLKPDGSCTVNHQHAVAKAVLTGCLRVSKESIFTGLNNLTVNTVCSSSQSLAQAIGFTASEVETLLAYYGLSSRWDDVKKWYDGYRFGGKDIFCPWDVINFCNTALDSPDPLTEPPQNFWLGTSGNTVINPFVDHLTKTDSEVMEKLLRGEVVGIEANEQVTYTDLEHHKSEDFWTLLLYAGYLTLVERKEDTFLLKIPNEEIRDSFKKRISWLFSKKNPTFRIAGEDIARAFLEGDALKAKTALLQVLTKYVSVRDSATRAPAENYYHGFLYALLISAEAGWHIANLDSNCEAGDGYADIVFTSADETVGVIVELKHCAPKEKARYARDALEQIREKRYTELLNDFGCLRTFAVGLAFSGRSCSVAIESVPLQST